jgi:hypothetical protein
MEEANGEVFGHITALPVRRHIIFENNADFCKTSFTYDADRVCFFVKKFS